MRQLTTFFNSFIKSLTSPKYYADVLKAKVSFSVKYFFLLTVLLSLVMAVKIAIPLSLFNLDATLVKVIEQYPADLMINVQNGKLAINKPLPYMIPVPADWKSENSPNYAVVFDTDKKVAGVRSFNDYNTAVLVTESTIYTYQDNNQPGVKAYPIPKEMENMTLSRGVLTEWKNHFMNLPLIRTKAYVVIIVLVLFLLSIPLLFLFRMVTAFFYAILTTIVASIFKTQILHGMSLSFTKFWQVSLHTLTLPIVLSSVLSIIVPFSPIHGFSYFLLYLVFTLFVLNQATQMGSKVTVAHKAVAKVAKATVTRKKTAKRTR